MSVQVILLLVVCELSEVMLSRWYIHVTHELNCSALELSHAGNYSTLLKVVFD